MTTVSLWQNTYRAAIASRTTVRDAALGTELTIAFVTTVCDARAARNESRTTDSRT
ncbi:hypothetical protein [Cohnella sp.]|uniref:hypothetical protein n=1 Tax=Cohnella sp. TaxID=1883426 RepID=UPI0035670039